MRLHFTYLDEKMLQQIKSNIVTIDKSSSSFAFNIAIASDSMMTIERKKKLVENTSFQCDT